jgi:hypothetical protein
MNATKSRPSGTTSLLSRDACVGVSASMALVASPWIVGSRGSRRDP